MGAASAAGQATVETAPVSDEDEGLRDGAGSTGASSSQARFVDVWPNIANIGRIRSRIRDNVLQQISAKSNVVVIDHLHVEATSQTSRAAGAAVQAARRQAQGRGPTEERLPRER